MQVGIWLFILGLAGLPLLLLHRPRHWPTLSGFVVLALGTLWLTQAGSQPLWDALAPMALIQFPFRLLAVVDLLLSLTAAGILSLILTPVSPASPDAELSPAVLVLALAVIFASYPYTSPQHTPVTARDQSPQAVIDFEMAYPDMRGSTAFASGQPNASPKVAAYLANEPLPLAGIMRGQGEITPQHHGAGSEKIHLSAQTPVTVQFYTYWYPGWRGKMDGKPLALRATGPDALITFDAPAGEHDITIRFGNTPLRTAAAALSLLSFLVIVLVLTGLDTRIRS
jgi:hypothetical protein